jgi:soluble lytic murein transglycosylase-like protein
MARTATGARGVLLQGYFSQQHPASTQDSAGLVAAQQVLLDDLSRQIATALAAHADWLHPVR